MIPSYSPQARGRSERHFKTIKGHLPNELALEGVRDMDAANDYPRERFWPDCNRRFAVPARASGDAFVPLGGVGLDDIPCLKEERVVGSDNCVSYGNRSLQIPPGPHGRHYVRRASASTSTPTADCRCSTARAASAATRPTARRSRERARPFGSLGGAPPTPRSTRTPARSGRRRSAGSTAARGLRQCHGLSASGVRALTVAQGSRAERPRCRRRDGPESRTGEPAR